MEDGTSSRTKHAMMPERFVRLLMCVCPPLHPHDLFFDPHHPSHKKHRPTTKSLLSSSPILTTTNTPTHRTGNYMGACQSVSSPKLITLLRIGADGQSYENGPGCCDDDCDRCCGSYSTARYSSRGKCLFPPEIHYTQLPPWSDRKTCLCVKVVFRGPSLLRPIGSHFECSVPPIPFLFYSGISKGSKGQSVSPQLYFDISLHIS
jgi:hypothetical protein